MKKTVKLLVLFTTASFILNVSHAQLKLPVLNGISNDVKKVIEDYPNRFVNLMGEEMSQNTQSTDYRCKFAINGAEESFVTRYSANKEICSWQGLMLTTESFQKAKQKFKALYNQLNNLPVSFGGSGYRLKGKYEEPKEEKKFASIIFSFEATSEAGNKLKAEISLQYEAPMEWKVRVLIYDREREDNERGKVNDQ